MAEVLTVAGMRGCSRDVIKWPAATRLAGKTPRIASESSRGAVIAPARRTTGPRPAPPCTGGATSSSRTTPCSRSWRTRRPPSKGGTAVVGRRRGPRRPSAAAAAPSAQRSRRQPGPFISPAGLAGAGEPGPEARRSHRRRHLAVACPGRGACPGKPAVEPRPQGRPSSDSTPWPRRRACWQGREQAAKSAPPSNGCPGLDQSVVHRGASPDSRPSGFASPTSQAPEARAGPRDGRIERTTGDQRCQNSR